MANWKNARSQTKPAYASFSWRKVEGQSSSPLPRRTEPKNADPRPRATASSSHAGPSTLRQVKLTPETAREGRIVWMPRFKPGFPVPDKATQGAQDHPMVITQVRPKASDGKLTVDVMPITSWDEKTVQEKWNIGQGVEFRKFYMLIRHDDPETTRAVADRETTLVVEGGKLMRKRCYVSLRDDPLVVQMENLDLYTSLNGDEEYFLELESLRTLKRLRSQKLFKDLSSVRAI